MLSRLFIDFETYWDEAYSLRKVTPIEYALDPRFEALGCSFVTDNSAVWVDGPDLPAFFRQLPWDNIHAVSHNALFDMLILAVRYGVVPKLYGDTLAMARNWLSASLSSHSLDAVTKYYGMDAKWDTVNKTKGINFEALRQQPELHRELRGYGIDDALKCRNIFNRMVDDGFPQSEFKVIDMVVRMAAQPQLELDQLVLAEHLAAIRLSKQELLDKIGFDDNKNLMSDNTFAMMLRMQGVEPPMKMSKTTGLMATAFAKSDKEFTALLEHENINVQNLVAARLGHKSTIEETRTERLLNISHMTRMIPVPLKYSGAHTHRFSGDWKINLQNLPREGRLRYALKAPKGKVVVSVDASQIEARLNAVLSGQWDLVEQFRNGEDVYSSFAEKIYNYKVNKLTHPKERFVGKTGILSLGYASSPPVFQNMCRVQGKVNLTDAEATSIVFIYRATYPQIVKNWDRADKTMLPLIAGSNSFNSQVMQAADANAHTWGPLKIEHNAILLPSGNKLRYRDLAHVQHMDYGFRWMFMRGNLRQSIYGAKLVENVIQALAFVHIMEVATRVADITNNLLLPAHQVHDELIYVVDEHLAEQVKDLVVSEMSKAPAWMPLAPLAAEGRIAPSYGGK